MTTSEPPPTGGSRRMWPTPSANQFECDPAVWMARREREKAKHRNGNGFGLTLSMAVQAEAMSLPLQPEQDDQPLTLFAVDSPASPSPSPGKGSRRRIAGGSGLRSTTPFALYVPHGSSSKTSPDSAIPAHGSPADAYAAGLTDGEGSLTITRSDRWYSARIEIGMTERALPVLTSMQEAYGGKVTRLREHTAVWETAWRWRLFGQEATAFTQRIRPYLRLKQEQADLILQLAQIKSSSPQAAMLKDHINLINRKGPRAAPTAGGHWEPVQSSLLLDSEMFLETWPGSGMTRNGTAYRRPTSVPPIYAAESGSLPTPRAIYGEHPGMTDPRHLTGAVHHWPTPRAADGMNDGMAAVINRLENGQLYKSRLKEAVAMMPTPTANRWDGLQSHGVNVVSGQLNPAWVEALMGYPTGWTDL